MRFALSSAGIFSQSDTTTNSQRFYDSVYDLLNDFNDYEAQREMDKLIAWWNRYDTLFLPFSALTPQ
jgi:hypothetical protein